MKDIVFEINYDSLKDTYSSVWPVNILISYPMRKESESLKSLTMNLIYSD